VDNFNQADLFADILPPMPSNKTNNKKRSAHPFQRSGSISRLPTLPDNLPEYRVIRKERRKRSISAFRQGGVIEIHIPARLSKRQELELIPEMIEMVLKREAKARKGDDQLLKIALEILEKYLPDFYERPTSITWRSMNERWGSCTTVDGTIRISERLINAPDYVLNYIIFHELIHLRVHAHDENFYEYLQRYTDQIKAEAFLEGYEIGVQSGNLGLQSGNLGVQSENLGTFS
jgi:predicted metal-dependent hydrolase